jgi:hypothetical protein
MVYTKMDMRVQNFDQNRGWEETERGWYEYEIQVPMRMTETYDDILEWLYNRIDNCERHARWQISRGLIQLKFRYERDVILCKLSF